jgi:UPF0755 protein
MSNAHDYLATIERLGAAQFADTGLATSHTALVHKVRVHRAVRASAISVASVGIVGGGAWGVLANLGGSADGQTPATATAARPSLTLSTDSTSVDLTVSFAAGDRLDTWVVDAATALEVDKRALLDAIAAAAPGDANPEGWIKPGMYFIPANATLTEVATQLVAQRTSQFEVLGVPRDQWQEVLTQASLVEAETPLASHMPKVARVIQNRLAKGLHLQLDSTVLYLDGVHGAVFATQEEREAESPYNTYLHPGLPPGAIGSPSDAAIDAVLHPADGDWLYFVTVNRDTGEMLFAKTYEEHLANVGQLRAWIDEQEG